MTREFYLKDGSKVTYEINESIKSKSGLCNTMYRLIDNDSECIKLFYNSENIKNENPIADMKAFETLMNMDLDNFYKIYNLLYNNTSEKELMGYIMKYYNRENINILDMPMEYLLDNFNKLCETVLKISKKGIAMNDLHAGNIILNSQEMVIIDGDGYTFFNALVKCDNKKALYNAFRDILLMALSNYYKSIDDKHLYIRGINKLFCTGNGTKEITKRLGRYKKPIDYFRYNLYK